MQTSPKCIIQYLGGDNFVLLLKITVPSKGLSCNGLEIALTISYILAILLFLGIIYATCKRG